VPVCIAVKQTYLWHRNEEALQIICHDGFNHISSFVEIVSYYPRAFRCNVLVCSAVFVGCVLPHL
jgi:hypothetical protein